MGVPAYWCNDIRGLQTGDDINAAVGYTGRVSSKDADDRRKYYEENKCFSILHNFSIFI